MGKYDDLEKLQKLKESGALTEEDFEKEKNKLLNGNNRVIMSVRLIFIIIFVIIAAVIATVVIMNNENKENTQVIQKKSTNEVSEVKTKTDAPVKTKQVGNSSELSFNSMKDESEELKLGDIQQEILNYFDNDYFNLDSIKIEDLERYPSIYKNAKVSLHCRAIKIVKSDSEEYQILVYPDSDGYGPTPNLEDVANYVILIKGSQLTERILEEDMFTAYGKYDDVETITVDGKSYTVPTVNVTEIAGFNSRFDDNTINQVAKYIFGENIKIREGIPPYAAEQPDSRYVDLSFSVVTLDDQSNENFKAFNICKNYGYIEYNWRVNDLPESIVKKLFISTDFQHYIVTTFDSGTEHVYIEYFDKSLQKLWRREFDYKSNSEYDVSPIDYSSTTMAVVVDNDLYIMDMNTGENIVEPILVGEKIRVLMLEDSILLVGNNNKNAIMLVDYQGNILKKFDADTIMNEIADVQIQRIEDRIVIRLKGYYETEDMYTPYVSEAKYIVLNKDKEIEVSTKDR